MNKRRGFLVATAAALASPGLFAQVLDHKHAAWTALLAKHVVLLRGGQASQASYTGFAAVQRHLGTQQGNPDIAFLDYDWSLNDAPRGS